MKEKVFVKPLLSQSRGLAHRMDIAGVNLDLVEISMTFSV